MMLADKVLCSGCGACASVCSFSAINMRESTEGFLYPEIDKDKCTSCGKCESACPVIHRAQNSNLKEKQVYAVISKDRETVLRSTSGGAFSALAALVIKSGGVVYGAGFDKNHAVLHKRVDTIENVALLTGSKYVQSYIGNTYISIEKDLKKGVAVLFVGTPCQCAGLSSYLGKEYDNLLIVDFVCHGVPSPKLYRKYLEYMSKGKEIASVNFRDKMGEETNGHNMGIYYSDGSVYRKKHGEGDLYILPFLQNISLRSSCYRCSFKGCTSGSDITIGDFWGIEDTDSRFKDRQGVSLFIPNTSKGTRAFKSIREDLEWDLRDLSEALKNNRAITTSTAMNPLRDDFYRDMNKLELQKLNDKYCGNSLSAKLRRFMARRRK